MEEEMAEGPASHVPDALTDPLLHQRNIESLQRLKQLVDPDNLLNPGVIINPDPQVHLANLKRMPVVEEEVDKCIECGYCEPVCPSKDLTTTPRQRIVVRRAIAEADERGDTALSKELRREQEYEVVETCAAAVARGGK